MILGAHIVHISVQHECIMGGQQQQSGDPVFVFLVTLAFIGYLIPLKTEFCLWRTNEVDTETLKYDISKFLPR